MEKKNKGFTLIEMLVVVLIIGILAGVALPQYQMAVTKAKVASILPLMRRWKDALYEYKLRHGEYCPNRKCPDAETLGVNWPSDWTCNDTGVYCSNDYWNECFPNEERTGYAYCRHYINSDGDEEFQIYMYQPDDPNKIFRDKITCYASGTEAHKICKALGGKLPAGEDSEYILY